MTPILKTETKTAPKLHRHQFIKHMLQNIFKNVKCQIKTTFRKFFNRSPMWTL